MENLTDGIKNIHKRLDKIRQIPKCVGCECVIDVMEAVQQDLDDIDQPIAKEVQKDLNQWVEEGNKVRHNCLGCEICYPIQPYNIFSKLINGTNEVNNAVNTACEDESCGCNNEKPVVSAPYECEDPSCSCNSKKPIAQASCECEDNSCSSELQKRKQKNTSCGCENPNEIKVVTSTSELEQNWPVAEGNYIIGNRSSSVAICTLADTDLPSEIRDSGLLKNVSIVGTLSTENLGIERLIRNIASNSKINQLILCGRDSRGHQAGQAILSLKENGIDDKHRIVGAIGPRPVIKNISEDEIEMFRKQVNVIDEIGTKEVERVKQVVQACEDNFNGQSLFVPLKVQTPKTITAQRLKNEEWVHDPEGFFLVLLDEENGLIKCEHYTQDGTLNEVIEGKLASNIANTAIKRGLLSRLDHAAYLGKELAKAETAISYNLPYTQDLPLKRSTAIKKSDIS